MQRSCRYILYNVSQKVCFACKETWYELLNLRKIMPLHRFADVFALLVCWEERNKFRPYTDLQTTISYAKILPTSTKKVYFQFVECSYILCKVTGKFGIGKIMGRVFHFFRVLSYFEWRGKATKKPDYCRAFLFCWLYELLLTSHVIWAILLHLGL